MQHGHQAGQWGRATVGGEGEGSSEGERSLRLDAWVFKHRLHCFSVLACYLLIPEAYLLYNVVVWKAADATNMLEKQGEVVNTHGNNAG